MATIPLRTRLALKLEQRLHQNLKKVHPLRQLFWECTLRCNVNCLHCGSDCKHDASKADMPAQDFLRVIDSITPHVDPRYVMIMISGGEPLVRRDLEEVGRELHRRQYPWGIVTNGLLLTRERLNSLLAAGMLSITVSLDGLEEDHNWMRGHQHSFEKAVQGIRLLTLTDGLAWDVVTCVNRRSIKRLNELKEFLISIGVKEWRVFTIVPMGRAAGNAELQLNNEEFRSLMDFIVATRKEGRILMSYSCEGFLGEYEGRVRDHFYSCQAGITVGSILHDGTISGCMSIRYDYRQGNIYEDDFMDVWNNRFQVYRNRDWARRDGCADCKMFSYCEGNAMHLHDDEGRLMFCHLDRM